MDSWDPEGEPVVGVVTDETSESSLQVDTLESTVADHDGQVVSGESVTVLETAPDVLVARGDATLSTLARAGLEPDVPILPVEPATGIDAVAPDRVDDALAAALEGEAGVRERSVLEATTPDGGKQRALFDVALVTDEPARISEYGVRSDREVATFRADGVVVATPSGSYGYASGVDAPGLSPAVDAVAVSPIAPFATDIRRWVLPPNVVLSVERDEGGVTVVADGREVGSVAYGERVTVSSGEPISTFVVVDALEDR